LLQETFVRVHKHLATLQETDRLAAWVYQIARNVIRDHYGKPSPEVFDVSDQCHDELAESPALQPELAAAAWLSGMIAALPDGYREAVRLSEIEERSQQDVADTLQLSLSGAKSRVQRGRALLRDMLERCCRIELDRRGRLLECDPKPGQSICKSCDETGDSDPASN
jgi:RNA polymerase sigma-70 factor (ECF subfamily)